MGVNFPSPVNNNYNNVAPVNNTTSPAAASPQQAEPAQETSVTPNQNSKSEYTGQQIKNSKFDPAAQNVSFGNPNEGGGPAPNALVALVSAGAAIVNSFSGGAYVEEAWKPIKETLDSTAKRLGELGTSAKISPFGSIHESDAERFKKMSEQQNIKNQ